MTDSVVSTIDTSTGAAPAASFHDMLPEDIRSDSSLMDIKDIGSLAKGYVNAQKMIGSSIRIPSEDASAEAKEDFFKKISAVPGITKLPNFETGDGVDEFYRQLGRPEAPEKYNFPEIEGLDVNEETKKSFSDLAFKVGLTAKQAEELYKFDAERNQVIQGMFEEYTNKSEQKLRSEWGPDFENRLGIAKQVLAQFSETDKESVEMLLTSPAASNPIVIKLLAEHGASLKETSSTPGLSKMKFGMSSEDARGQISDILSNPSHPYNLPYDPQHDAAVEKMTKLYELAYAHNA